jgi:energy-coupling factor transporter ATP-binding protein EcfA2
MRIENVRIVGYQILRDITIEPGQGYQISDDSERQSSIDLLVGVNGTGKSTLLRALAIIFQCLEQDNSMPPFGFSLTYTLDERPDKIFISNLDNETPPTILRYFRFRLGENGEENVRKIGEEYLPRHIIALTSGSEAGWIYNGSQIDETETGLLSRDIQPTADIENLLISWSLTEVRGAPPETLCLN